MQSRKILILTTGQPSTNPRVVKEYLAFRLAGHDVKVLYSYWSAWADKQQMELFRRYELNETDFILVGGRPTTQKMLYFITRLLQKIAQRVFPNSVAAVARTGYFLYKKALQYPSDLYIGHNLGALPAAVLSAKRNNGKAGFDAEDFHRGEVPEGSILQKRAIRIEEKYFPELAYFTAASPLIREHYHRLFPKVASLCINNVFSKKFIKTAHIKSEKRNELKFWWFSQKTGKGRGIEDVIAAMGKIEDRNISLCLLGEVTQEMKEYFLLLADEYGVQRGQIEFLPPVTETDLFRIGSGFDVGLALEIGTPYNRQICLTNKIFTYLLTGNAVIFSRTKAQRVFWEENPECGVTYDSGNVQQLAQCIVQYYDNRDILLCHQTAARKLAAEKYNWEQESDRLVSFLQSEVF